jgi:ABC-type multidrug transport system fused ATPase/permease subunit
MAFVAWWQLQNGLTAPGAVAGCIAGVVALRKPVKSLSTSFVEMQRAFAAIHRLRWALAQGVGVVVGRELDGAVREVELRGVAFSYDGRRQVLKDVNLVLRRGERVAIVGPSGSGKTTLLDLITGFYPCTSGAVLLDGADLSAIDPGSWRRQIGIVSQEPFLFDATIEENIRHGCSGATPEQVAEAARRAGCDEMLRRLPDGLRTGVGERGCRLSGGERKRVAIARALVRPISLLVLDEATSELDAEMEEAVLRTVDGLAAQLTVLHVSHRPSVLAHCDRALRLDGGRIRDAGTANERGGTA